MFNKVVHLTRRGFLAGLALLGCGTSPPSSSDTSTVRPPRLPSEPADGFYKWFIISHSGRPGVLFRCSEFIWCGSHLVLFFRHDFDYSYIPRKKKLTIELWMCPERFGEYTEIKMNGSNYEFVGSNKADDCLMLKFRPSLF